MGIITAIILIISGAALLKKQLKSSKRLEIPMSVAWKPAQKEEEMKVEHYFEEDFPADDRYEDCEDDECGICHICQESHKTSEHPKKFVYQLAATGTSRFGKPLYNVSKTAFETKALAEIGVPIFREFLLNSNASFVWSPDDLNIIVVPLEVVGEKK